VVLQPRPHQACHVVVATRAGSTTTESTRASQERDLAEVEHRRGDALSCIATHPVVVSNKPLTKAVQYTPHAREPAAVAYHGIHLALLLRRQVIVQTVARTPTRTHAHTHAHTRWSAQGDRVTAAPGTAQHALVVHVTDAGVVLATVSPGCSEEPQAQLFRPSRACADPCLQVLEDGMALMHELVTANTAQRLSAHPHACETAAHGATPFEQVRNAAGTSAPSGRPWLCRRSTNHYLAGQQPWWQPRATHVASVGCDEASEAPSPPLEAQALQHADAHTTHLANRMRSSEGPHAKFKKPRTRPRRGAGVLSSPLNVNPCSSSSSSSSSSKRVSVVSVRAWVSVASGAPQRQAGAAP